MDINITKRQEELLFCIIEEYIKNATAVGSNTIIKKYMTNVSAATIRNEMSVLEKKKLIEKTHNSSGRIPSILGYKYYYENSYKKNDIDVDVKQRLKKIFANRSYSVNNIIERTTDLLSDIFNLPSVVVEIDSNELLKRVDMVQISEDKILIVVITSSGNISKNIIDITRKEYLNDISICVRLFNDRLIDTPISQIDEKINLLKDIIKEKVFEYEFIMQEFISKIFSLKIKFKKIINGRAQLLKHPEFINHYSRLESFLNLLESTSIWEQIAYEQTKSNGKTKIIFGDNIGIDDVCIASTQLSVGTDSTQISIVGPTRMDYKNVQNILNFIRDEFNKIINGK